MAYLTLIDLKKKPASPFFGHFQHAYRPARFNGPGKMEPHKLNPAVSGNPALMCRHFIVVPVGKNDFVIETGRRLTVGKSQIDHGFMVASGFVFIDRQILDVDGF